jgi:predicted nucleic-acid-binding Zn-ribbon protein
MPGSWFARQYQRTCNQCGYTWLVPRSIARRGVRGMTAVSARGASVQAGINVVSSAGLSAAIGARAEVMEAYRLCAKCGVDDFVQHPVRSDRSGRS